MNEEPEVGSDLYNDEDLSPELVTIRDSLHTLLNSLLELGVCASDTQSAGLEGNGVNAFSDVPGGLVGRKVTDAVRDLGALHALAPTVQDVLIPIEVIDTVDNSRNPHLYTRNFVERVASENQYTNGILRSVQAFRDDLVGQLELHFPQINPNLHALGLGNASTTGKPSDQPKMEE